MANKEQIIKEAEEILSDKEFHFVANKNEDFGGVILQMPENAKKTTQDFRDIAAKTFGIAVATYEDKKSLSGHDLTNVSFDDYLSAQLGLDLMGAADKKASEHLNQGATELPRGIKAALQLAGVNLTESLGEVEKKIEPTINRYVENLSSNISSVDVKQGQSWFLKTLVLAYTIERSKIKMPDWKQYIASTIPVGTATEVHKPVMRIGRATVKEMREYDTMPTLGFSETNKVAKVKRYKSGFTYAPDELKDLPINILPLALESIYDEFEKVFGKMVVNTLLMGDQADGSMTAESIGVKAVGQLDYEDMLKPHVRFQRLGLMQNMSQWLVNEEVGTKIALMPEFRGMTNYTGFKTADVAFANPSLYPSAVRLDIHDGIPNNTILYFDKSTALHLLTGNGFSVEAFTDNFNQVAKYRVVFEGFGLMTNSTQDRIIIDLSTLYSSNPLGSPFDVLPSYYYADPSQY